MDPLEGTNMNYTDLTVLILFIFVVASMLISVWLMVKIHIQDGEIEVLQKENRRLRTVSDDIYRLLLEKDNGDIPM